MREPAAVAQPRDPRRRRIGWEAGTRTPIHWSRASCPTIERPPSRSGSADYLEDGASRSTAAPKAPLGGPGPRSRVYGRYGISNAFTKNTAICAFVMPASGQ